MPAVAKTKTKPDRATIEQQLAEKRAALGDAAIVGADTAALHREIRALEDQVREADAVRDASARAQAKQAAADSRARDAATIAELEATVRDVVTLGVNLQRTIDSAGALAGQLKQGEQKIRGLLLQAAGGVRDWRDDAAAFALIRLVEIESALSEAGAIPRDQYPGTRDVSALVEKRARSALATGTQHLSNT